jgi:S1-C subfamily serine protease
LRVVAVGDGGAAELAGLKPGDRIAAIDGVPPAARWPEAIAHKAAGAPLVLAVTRGQHALELHLTLGSEHDLGCKLTQAAATPAVTKLRDQLLSP